MSEAKQLYEYYCGACGQGINPHYLEKMQCDDEYLCETCDQYHAAEHQHNMHHDPEYRADYLAMQA